MVHNCRQGDRKVQVSLGSCLTHNVIGPLQATQALQVDQVRDFQVNYQDRRSGELRLSIKVPISSPAQLDPHSLLAMQHFYYPSPAP